MNTRQANQAIKEAAKEGKNAYYSDSGRASYSTTYGYNGTRVTRARTKGGAQQVLELWSGKWVAKSFSDLYYQ
jgi:hypothetical protein